MTPTPLKRIADLTTEVVDDSPHPLVALEHLESGTGKLLAEVQLIDVAPGPGVATVAVGDVLLGKLRPYLAKSWVADRPTYASTELLCLRPQRDIDSRWLGYVVASSPLIEWAVATSDGTKMPRTSWEKLGEFRLVVPSVKTQGAIANYLDRETARINALIRAKRQMRELLEERVRLLAHAWTTRDGDTMPLRRFVRTVKTGTTPPAEEFTRLSGGAVPWYSPADVGEWLRLSEPERTLKAEAITTGWVPQFPPQSILLVGIGATAGKIAFLDHAASGNQQMTCLVTGRRVVPRFLSWQLFARRDEIRATAPFTTLPIINNEFIRSLSIVVPPIAKQVDVVGRLDDEATRAQALADRAGRQIALLQERRQALITAAVTGQLDIPEIA